LQTLKICSENCRDRWDSVSAQTRLINMAQILKKIIDDLDNDEVEILNILDCFDNETQKELFEKWVKIYFSITPFTIKEGLKKIKKDFILTDEEEIMLLSYVKFFERRLMDLKGDVEARTEKFESEDNGGGMFV